MHRRTFNQLLAGSALTALRPGLNAQTHPASPQASQTSGLPPFKFSIMLWTISKQLSLDASLELAAAAGYNGVELVGEFKHWPAEESRHVMSRLQALGLVVDAMSGVDAGFADPAGTEPFLSQLKLQLQAAQALACPRVILLSGDRIAGISPQAQHSAAVENLKRAAEMAHHAQVELLIEPIDLLENASSYLTSVTEGFSIVRAVASDQVRLLYDIYHEQRGSGNLIEKLEANIDLVGLVHIADVPGRHEPGTGEINYANIYRKLAALGYDRYIAMEYYPTGDLLASFTRQRTFAQNSANVHQAIAV